MSEKENNQGPLEGLSKGIVAGLTKHEFSKEIKDSFLDYAVSTLTARAIPDARDGLKPVQRRIIYDMWDMGITPDKPFKKSARVVGDVMGKYHPHGNSAIYLAMARLAQDFAMRYTLVEGHGNFGSSDGDEPAAERYTEARMAKIALEMVRDLDKETVPFTATYDNEGTEPVVLPSRIPNLLCNESSGIAVGMATSIPPHNLRETIDAVVYLIKHPDMTTDDLMNIIKGPDFPCGGVVMGRSGIKKYFETGRGVIKVRAKYEIVEKGDRADIVFYELPYMVNKRTLAKKIVELSENKTISDISAVADYSSNKMGTHFVVSCKKGANVSIVLNHLFKYTSLQSSFPVNMLALDNGTPKVLSMRQALDIYIKHQENVITNRTKFDLRKALDRIHILEAFLAVADAIDETVAIIKNSKTTEEASSKLKERFGFDDVQCKAILDMQLRRLTGLEHDKYMDEKNSLSANVEKYNLILSDRSELENTLINELEEIKKIYGDNRRTEISDAIFDEDDEDLIANKEILIILSSNGYIKRVDPSEFRLQRRGGVGVQGMKTKDDEDVQILRHSYTKTDVLFFTNFGKVYRCRGYQIFEGSRNSRGTPAINFLRLAPNEKITSIISTDNYGEGSYLFFATKNGVVKRCPAIDFKSINASGKIAVSLKEGDELIDVKQTDGTNLISLASSSGHVCTFSEDEVRSMGRLACGVRGMSLNEGEKVVGVVTDKDGSKIFTLSTEGYGKITDISAFRKTKRGAKGVMALRANTKAGDLMTIKAVRGIEDIIVITDAGTTIKTSLEQVSTTISRTAIGVKVISLREGENISSCCICPTEEDYEATDNSIETQDDESEEKIIDSMISNTEDNNEE